MCALTDSLTVALPAAAGAACERRPGMQNTLLLKKAAGTVAGMALLLLAFAAMATGATASAERLAGQESVTTCSDDPRMAKIEPGLCSSPRLSHPAAAVVTATAPTTKTTSSGLNPMWIALVAVVLAAAAGTVAGIHRHRPHAVG